MPQDPTKVTDVLQLMLVQRFPGAVLTAEQQYRATAMLADMIDGGVEFNPDLLLSMVLFVEITASLNTLPGWSGECGMQEFLTEVIYGA